MTNKKKRIMWYKVQELKAKHYNKSQISRATSLDRATVSKYLKMSEQEFYEWLSKQRQRPLKLSQYTNFVLKEIKSCPELSAAQIEDHLKEHYKDLPPIHSKTIFNFVQTIREKYDIPKPKLSEQRLFEKLPELPYGEQAQVDFGETWLQTPKGSRKKVYFFAIVLSRSRYKYVYFSDKPFTSSKAIEAHNQSFDYFEGVPKEILYDQDSVFIHNENLGDYLLTEEFGNYCKTQNFKHIFCRKADPQSKGKIENVVKYVKQNFLRGRLFTNIQTLQEQVVEWLDRTANVKIHASTKKVPKDCWEEEKKHLLPIKNKFKQRNEFQSYNVRKDNTIVYKSNFYSLPLGSYKGSKTQVLVKISDDKIQIYSTKKELLATHKISIERGQYIRNTDHGRPKSQTLEKLKSECFKKLGNTEIAKEYLEKLHKDKARYYRDNLHEILKHPFDYEQEIIDTGLLACLENKVFNAYDLIKIIKSKNIEKQQIKQANLDLNILHQNQTPNAPTMNKIDVETSNINDYEKYF